MANKSVIDIGRILALIGAVLGIVLGILELLSISLGFGVGLPPLGGIVGTIVAIVLMIIATGILIDRIRINDEIVKYIIILVLGLVSGNLLVILGGILLIIGYYMS